MAYRNGQYSVFVTGSSIGFPYNSQGTKRACVKNKPSPLADAFAEKLMRSIAGIDPAPKQKPISLKEGIKPAPLYGLEFF